MTDVQNQTAVKLSNHGTLHLIDCGGPADPACFRYDAGRAGDTRAGSYYRGSGLMLPNPDAASGISIRYAEQTFSFLLGGEPTFSFATAMKADQLRMETLFLKCAEITSETLAVRQGKAFYQAILLIAVMPANLHLALMDMKRFEVSEISLLEPISNPPFVPLQMEVPMYGVPPEDRLAEYAKELSFSLTA